MRRRLALLAPLALLALPSCGSTSDATTADAAVDSGAADGNASSLRTLATCKTDVAAGAPEFFKRYFRCSTITVTDTTVTIESESLPPHKSYYWGKGDPNYAEFDTTRGSDYLPNPNRLRAQRVKLTIPLSPVAKGSAIAATRVDGMANTDPDEFPLGPAGVALDSVALFNPLARPGDDIEDEKFTFDGYNAHPNEQGAYHYHTASPGPLEVLTSIGATGVELYGIMCDGTVVLGCSELNGAAPVADTDAQGGHVHDLVDGAGTKLLTGRYHVHVCPGSGRKYTPEIQYYSTCTRA